MSKDLHVVLGATGGAGRAIAHALAARGTQTRTVNRTGTIVHERATALSADVERADGARSAVQGASVVYMAAQPPYTEWPDRFPAMLENVIQATAAAGAKLVMVGNLYGYGPATGPMTENTVEAAGDRKGVARRRMTEMLLDAHGRGVVRVAIGRASDYFGPGADNSAVTALVIAPAASGKTIRWIGRLDVRHSVAYLPDVARAYVTLGSSHEADGEIWHLPHPPAATGAEFMTGVRGVTGGDLKTRLLSKSMLRLVSPFHGVSRETLQIMHQWDRPFVVDDTKFRDAFGPFLDTPLDQAIRTSVEWYRGAWASASPAGTVKRERV